MNLRNLKPQSVWCTLNTYEFVVLYNVLVSIFAHLLFLLFEFFRWWFDGLKFMSCMTYGQMDVALLL